MPLRDGFSRLDIIGRGPLETEVKRRASACAQFHFLGVKTNREVQERMRTGDLLVLPSLYDGWGTVVNEALQNGMRVLCSDACGASVLLDGCVRGASFPAASMDCTVRSLSVPMFSTSAEQCPTICSTSRKSSAMMGEPPKASVMLAQSLTVT